MTDTEISKDPGDDFCESEDARGPNRMSDLAADVGVTVAETGNYVTMAMLDSIRKQLEEKHEEDIRSLKSAFDSHMEERRENEKKLKTCVETLITEVLRLEEKIIEIEKSFKAKPPPPQKQQPQPQHPNSNWEDSDTAFNDGDTQPHDLLQVKMEDVEGDDGGDFQDMSYQTDPLREDDSTSSAPPKSTTLLQEDSDSNEDFQVIEEGHQGTHLSPESEEVVTHGKADGVGTFLPFMCICGLEFDSEAFLSDHILEEEQEEQMRQEEEEANYDPAADWDTPQIQVDNVVSIKPSSTGPKRIRSRKKAGLRLKDAHHECHPSNPLHCLCGQVFRSNRKLLRHVRYYTTEKDCFSCMLCGKVFGYASHLKSHMLKSHNLNLPVKTVPKILEGKSKIHTSKVNNPTSQPYPVLSNALQKAKSSSKQPPKKAWHRYDGKSHGQSPSHPLHCLCGLQCRDNAAILKHIKYFTEIKKKATMCKICGQKYPYASQLNAHIARVHPRKGLSSNGHEGLERPIAMATTSGYPDISIPPPPYPNPVKNNVEVIQNQKTQSIPNQTYIRTSKNTSPKPVPRLGNVHAINPSHPLHCLCGSKYRDKIKLWKHVNYYNVYKKTCQLCEQAFPSASKLTAHIASVHGGNSDLSSANGLEQEPTSSSLKSPRKPSPRSTSSIQHGMGEETTDSEGKPQYSCKCGRSYVSKGVLHFHIRMASSGKLLQCHLCPEGSKQFSLIQLKYHMRAKHNVE